MHSFIYNVGIIIGLSLKVGKTMMNRPSNRSVDGFELSRKMGEILTLTLPGPSAGVSGSLDSYCSLKPLCSGMGGVVPARTSPTLLPPSPCTVLPLSCFKVSQCINCRDWHFKG